MKAFIARKSDRRGSALVIVMCVASILLMAGLSMTWMTSAAAFRARKVENYVRALAIAEAGVGDCINRMTTNYIYWCDRQFTTEYAGGTYWVSNRMDTNSGHVLITSKGVIGKDRRTTVLELLGTIYDLYDQVLGVNGCIVAGGNVTFKSAAVTINGDVHANGSVILDSPAQPTVTGNVSACGTVDVAAGGTVSEGAAPVTVQNLATTYGSWYNLATNGGLYFPGDVSWSGEVLLPGNGVIYVDGDVEISGRSEFTGTLVATGDIKLFNQFTHTPYDTNWPCMLAMNNVYCNNRDNYYGIIWAGNDIYTDNQRTLTGALIAMNNVEVNNRLTLTPLPYFPAWDPEDTNQNPPTVIIGGWLQ